MSSVKACAYRHCSHEFKAVGRGAYCSALCRHREKYARKCERQGLPVPSPESMARQEESRVEAKKARWRKCAFCGERFFARNASQTCCSISCGAKQAHQKAGRNVSRDSKKPIDGKPRPSSLRACHDCKKPTTDYRCPACLTNWRRKHGVALSGELHA